LNAQKKITIKQLEKRKLNPQFPHFPVQKPCFSYQKTPQTPQKHPKKAPKIAQTPPFSLSKSPIFASENRPKWKIAGKFGEITAKCNGFGSKILEI
jgi:hypothetical protein